MTIVSRRILAGLLVVSASPVAADPLDELGFGAAATGMANARMPTGVEAIHGDPSGLALADRPELLLGWQYSHDRLAINGAGADVLDAHGTSFGLAIPFRVRDYKLGAGIGLYLPDQYLARIQLTPIGEPTYVRFESATQRMVIEPVVAIARGNWSAGAGLSLLADARSREIAFDVGLVAGDKQGDARLDIELPVRVAPLAGVRWRSQQLEVALSYRGELSLDVALDIGADIDVPNVVTGDVTIALRSVTHFTPMRVTLAGAFAPREDLTLSANATYERWSALGSGVADLRVLLDLDIEPPLVESMQPAASFRDIVNLRAGAEWRTRCYRWRAGIGYLPSPVPAQTGLTSFADGDRTLATAGFGLRIAPNAILAQPIDLDLAIAWHHIFDELVRKDVTLAPGGAFSSGGEILQASASATVRF